MDANGNFPYNEGITGKIFNAIKSSGQKIKSVLESGQRPDQILGNMLPAAVKIFSTPSMGDYKVEQPDNNNTPLHAVVKQAESGGNYDALYGTNSKVPLSNMTIGEVMALQKHYVDSGSPSSAAGAYQFLRPTLSSLVKSGAVSLNDPFDKNTQDRLATALMERRGLSDFKSGKITKEQFLDNLSKEWAGLPTTSGQSYYEGDGLNHSTVRVPKVFASMAGL
jgi:muramidase (phage lysozyme)